MPEWDGQKFALIMPWGRVGSNLVVGVLTSIRGVVISNEPTTSLKTLTAGKPNSQFQADMEQTRFMQSWPEVPASSLLQESYESISPILPYGLKLSHRSFVSPMTIYSILRDRNFRVVRMDRRNHVKSAVSQIRAEQRYRASGGAAFAIPKGHERPGPSTLSVRQVVAKTQMFEKFSSEMESYLAQVVGGSILECYYEDLLRTPQDQIRRVADFLNISLPAKFELAFEKATSDRLRDDILNYDEVAAALVEAGYGAYVDP